MPTVRNRLNASPSGSGMPIAAYVASARSLAAETRPVRTLSSDDSVEIERTASLRASSTRRAEAASTSEAEGIAPGYFVSSSALHKRAAFNASGVKDRQTVVVSRKQREPRKETSVSDEQDGSRIQIQANGPYLVYGSVPLVRKHAVSTKQDERVAWARDEAMESRERYALCRCGGSSKKPFCDGTHKKNDFDGTETAPTETYASQREEYAGPGMTLFDAKSFCEHSAFCGNNTTNVWKMIPRTEDTEVRSLAIAMVERCPSGRLTYELDGQPVEPDLPVQIAVVKDGPLWVTGGITVERSDRQPLEVRNRMTFCRCGASRNKPFCDGTHAEIGFTEPAA